MQKFTKKSPKMIQFVVKSVIYLFILSTAAVIPVFLIILMRFVTNVTIIAFQCQMTSTAFEIASSVSQVLLGMVWLIPCLLLNFFTSAARMMRNWSQLQSHGELLLLIQCENVRLNFLRGRALEVMIIIFTTPILLR